MSGLNKVADCDEIILANEELWLNEIQYAEPLICWTTWKFLVAEMQTFILLKSESFIQLLRLCLKCKAGNLFLPKADAICHNVLDKVNDIKEQLKQELRLQFTKIYLSIDAWTCSNCYSFNAIILHYPDENFAIKNAL